MPKSNNRDVRNDNRNLIRQAMLKTGIQTKETLADITGLSSATCRNILLDMLEQNEIMELAVGKPQGGRPPRRFQYNAEYVYFALCRIKSISPKRELELRIVDAAGRLIQMISACFDFVQPELLADFIEAGIRKYDNLGAVAVSYPGVVLNGKSSCWGDIEELNGFDLAAIIEERAGESVVIENDINLAAWGYHIRHETVNNLVYIGFPQNNLPGCGLIVDGRLLRGTRGFAGEVIYIPDRSLAEIRNEMAAPHGVSAMLPAFLRSATALLDPEVIVIATADLTDEEEFFLREKLCGMSRPEFLPKLDVILDYQIDNVAGLLEFARKQFYRKMI